MDFAQARIIRKTSAVSANRIGCLARAQEIGRNQWGVIWEGRSQSADRRQIVKNRGRVGPADHCFDVCGPMSDEPEAGHGDGPFSVIGRPAMTVMT